MKSSDIVYIGTKPTMTYVLPVIQAYNACPDGIYVRARGRAILGAIDVVELCRNKFLSGVSEPEVKIGTEALDGDSGTRNVSVISIYIKPDGSKPAKAEAKAPVKKTAKPKRPVSEIKGVGEVIEEKLMAAGYTSAEAVASEDPGVLAEKAGLSEKQAANLVEAAKLL